MLRGFQGLVVAAVIAVLFGGDGVEAGIYSPPPGDDSPVWSPDGSAIVYLSQRRTPGLRVMNADGTEDRLLPLSLPTVLPIPFEFSPGWFWVAIGGHQLVVSRPDGSARRTLGEMAFGSTPTWSPDGRTIAFSRVDGLHVVDVDASSLRRVSGRYASRADWSPDGQLLAFWAATPKGSDVFVARSDGTSETNLTGPLPGAHASPVWSPDGRHLAFLTTEDHRRLRLGVVSRDGVPVAQFERPWSGTQIAWSPDGRRLLVSGSGVWLVDLGTSGVRLLSPFGSNAGWAPDGAQVAFAGAGECRDRAGIYRMDTGGGRVRRLTNDCRIVGSARGERLRGTDLADVLLGLGGDDRLVAVDPAYTGDTLLGGPGADVLVGDRKGDVLNGGAGDDRLTAGPGPDVLRGGPGTDLLRGDGGRDHVISEDGRRDVVSCGTNRLRGTGPESDVAWADRRDAVSRDCELVYRGGRVDVGGDPTRLTIRVNRVRQPPERDDVWILRCRPAGGTLPNPAQACRTLATMALPLAPVPYDRLCAATPDPAGAHVSGLLFGIRVDFGFGRHTTCELARWDRHRFLLQPR